MSYPLAYGSTMAGIDAFAFSLVKAIHIGWVKEYFLFIPVLMYSIQPLILYSSLNYETVAVMNFIWDLFSDIFLTIISIFVFRERISSVKMLGIFFAFVSLILLNWN